MRILFLVLMLTGCDGAVCLGGCGQGCKEKCQDAGWDQGTLSYDGCYCTNAKPLSEILKGEDG